MAAVEVCDFLSGIVHSTVGYNMEYAFDEADWNSAVAIGVETYVSALAPWHTRDIQVRSSLLSIVVKPPVSYMIIGSHLVRLERR